MTATRFEEPSSIFNSLGSFPRFGGSITSPPRLPALYAAGREIGDEYRYILERRRARTTPQHAAPPWIAAEPLGNT
ncbi:hypothetical protein [Verrucomicrobium spinosum]|uniref:hypothetical protein n=1 Tax=Verrucomicrobium spinosum TaxID=2736 RepID=UPI0009462D35|nr:hypothetical protein [Verrucomicrobium spinosum]